MTGKHIAETQCLFKFEFHGGVNNAGSEKKIKNPGFPWEDRGLIA
jgi:hypothetical protein